jgi:hypothetical protein
MRRSLVAQAEPSKLDPAPKGGKSRTKGRQIHPAILIFLEVYREHKKPAAILEGLTGASRSFCEKVLDGRKRPGADMLEALIRSHFGDQVVDAIAATAPARPTWHRQFRRSIERSSLRDQIREMQRRLEALEEGDQ